MISSGQTYQICTGKIVFLFHFAQSMTRILQKSNKAILECTQLVTNLKARWTIQVAKKVKNAQSSKDLQKVIDLQHGHEVLVFRESRGRQLYELVPVRENGVDVIFPGKNISNTAVD